MFLPKNVYLKARVCRNIFPEDYVPNSHSCEKKKVSYRYSAKDLLCDIYTCIFGPNGIIFIVLLLPDVGDRAISWNVVCTEHVSGSAQN